MQTPEDLSEQAKIAWQAFLDMGDSKRAYFSCQEAIEAKYETGGMASDEEKRELEKLLALHDRNVIAFNTAMTAVTDEKEKEILLRLMS